DPRFVGGVFVAAGDFDNDGRAEIVTGADAGGSPHVRVFRFLDAPKGSTDVTHRVQPFRAPLANFFAFAPNFGGGVRVAVGDVNGDGTPDVITGAGPGGGPVVRAFSGKDGKVIRQFFAYAPTFTGGVFVAAGPYLKTPAASGRFIDDILVGPGAGMVPDVRVFNGQTGALVTRFIAFGGPAKTGVGGVTFADLDGDDKLDILVGTGRGV